MTVITVFYHLALSAAVMGLLFLFYRERTSSRFVRLTFYGFMTALTLGFLIGDAFDRFYHPVRGEWVLIQLPSNLRLFSQGLFIEGGIFFLVCAWAVWRDVGGRAFRRRFLSGGLLLLALMTFGIGIDAYWIEPFALKVRQLEIRSPKIPRPIRLVLVTDIQSDVFGDYEKRVMAKIRAQRPDILLFGGDYYQYSRNSVETENRPWNYRPETYGRTMDLPARLNRFLKENRVNAPGGCYAVGGTSFREPFEKDHFEGTGIHYFDRTETLLIHGEIKLTGLSNKDTWMAEDRVTEALAEAEAAFNGLSTDATPEETTLDVVSADTEKPADHKPDSEKSTEPFSIILGHCPSFILARPKADLLLAGHTHGGQIQIPGFGPLLTMTPEIPRKLASGHHLWADDDGTPNHLIVSNGVGLERAWAPRVRLFCRPDIWVIDLLPED